MKEVLIIGGGPAGMQAAASLAALDKKVYLVEKTDKLGGHLLSWDRLFPNLDKSQDILENILSDVKEKDDKIEIIYSTSLRSYKKKLRGFEAELTNGKVLNVDAILLSTGFELFRAERKEEYGYGIYDNVITSADLEQKFIDDRVLNSKGEKPKRMAFVHCVGSRDEKVDNTYCSKVCCVTAVKQACEIKEMYPDTEVFNLYMDLRMFDRGFEQMYHTAQSKYGINFVRGRLSEVSETIDGKIQIKTEDTLLGKPLKLTVDILVLMVGMEACKSSEDLAEKLNLKISASDHFFEAKDSFTNSNHSGNKGVFVCGTCLSPKSLPDTLKDASMAAYAINEYLSA